MQTEDDRYCIDEKDNELVFCRKKASKARSWVRLDCFCCLLFVARAAGTCETVLRSVSTSVVNEFTNTSSEQKPRWPKRTETEGSLSPTWVTYYYSTSNVQDHNTHDEVLVCRRIKYEGKKFNLQIFWTMFNTIFVCQQETQSNKQPHWSSSSSEQHLVTTPAPPLPTHWGQNSQWRSWM